MLTGEQLTDEVKEIIGRSEDTVLITDTRVARWLNEAQDRIIEECPGLHSLTFKNTTSIDTTVTLRYAISDITVGDSSDNRVCHIFDVWYLDGNESRHLNFLHIDEFDEEWPDPTHSDIPKTKPSYWTRRGNYIEMTPLCLTAYCDKDLRFDGDYYPRDFTLNDAGASDFSQADADKGLILYAVGEAWAAIGSGEALAKSQLWKKKFSNPEPLPGEDVGWLEKFKARNDILYEWEGNLYGDGLE